MSEKMYVDNHGLTLYVDVNPEEVAAISDICVVCKGLCCSNFTVSVDTEKVGDAWVPNWKAMIARANPDQAKDLEFMSQHFKPTGQITESGRVEFCCDAQDAQGLCGEYLNRPKLCRGYVCGSAWKCGKPPGLDNSQQSQAKGGKHEGFEPDQTVRQLWKDIIQPRLAMEAVALAALYSQPPETVCTPQEPEAIGRA